MYGRNEDSMTDSSPEKTTETPAKDKATVPVAAVGQARHEKRVAEQRAEAAETAAAGQPDISAIIDAVTAAAITAANERVDKEVAPLKARAAKAEMALQLGLSAAQVDKVMEIKAANPTLDDQKALILAKAEHADLFPQARPSAWNPALHGALPTSGASDLRSAPAQPDFTKNMHEAAAKGDQQAATHWATKAALDRFKTQFLKDRPQYQ